MNLSAYLVPHPPIMVPAVGGSYLKEIPETIKSMREISKRIKRSAVSSLVILSPHSPIVANSFCVKDGNELSGNLGMFRASEIKIDAKVDIAFRDLLIKKCSDLDVPLELLGKSSSRRAAAGYALDNEGNVQLDHGVLAPLSFIYENGSYELNSLSYSWLSVEDHYKFGKAIQNAVLGTINSNIAFIVSGDLSHRLTRDAPAGYDPLGKEFDQFIKGSLQNKDFSALLNIDPELREAAGECGMNSIFVMLGFFDGFDVEVQILSYEGPFGVGYLAAELIAAGNDPSRKFF